MAIAGGVVLTISVVLAGNAPMAVVPGRVCVARMQTFAQANSHQWVMNARIDKARDLPVNSTTPLVLLLA